MDRRLTGSILRSLGGPEVTGRTGRLSERRHVRGRYGHTGETRSYVSCLTPLGSGRAREPGDRPRSLPSPGFLPRSAALTSGPCRLRETAVEADGRFGT